MTLTFATLLAAALTFTPADAHLALETARSLVENCTPRDAGTIRGRIAANHILDAASAVGANVHRDTFKASTPLGEREFTNLYAEFKTYDEEARWVVLVSHYDTKSGVNCPGANDGAATSGLLVALASELSSWSEPKGNVLLVWADGEECMRSYGPEDGLWGSKRAVNYLKTQDRKVQAVICLDMLGDKDLTITIPRNVTPSLAKIALHAARRVGYTELVTQIGENVTDDHVPFLDAGYSAVDFIDFSYGPQNAYWHTSEDKIEHISEESLLKSGKLVVEMLGILL